MPADNYFVLDDAEKSILEAARVYFGLRPSDLFPAPFVTVSDVIALRMECPAAGDLLRWWASRGEQCPVGLWADGGAACPHCNSTGWLRPPTPLDWTANRPDEALALRWAVVERLSQGKPVLGRKGPWQWAVQPDGAKAWTRSSTPRHHRQARPTTAAGKAAADLAAAEAGWWLSGGVFEVALGGNDG